MGDELITNMDGRIGPISLPYGEYYIKEVRFPAGYGSATGKTYPFELLILEEYCTCSKQSKIQRRTMDCEYTNVTAKHEIYLQELSLEYLKKASLR